MNADLKVTSLHKYQENKSKNENALDIYTSTAYLKGYDRS
jgi:hypothetical protein